MNGCNTREDGEFRVVAVSGEVDLSWSADIRTEILNGLKQGESLLVDLSEVTYIDSSGIAALVEGYQTAKAKDQRFGLLSASASVRAVLELARLDQVFPMFDDMESARA